MHYYKLGIPLVLFVVFGAACQQEQTEQQNQTIDISQVVPLPVDLKNTDSIDFAPLMEMLGGARIIGLGEALHVYHEPLDFRNALMKHLVREKRIDVVAMETGAIESKVVYDYVNGADMALDTALFYGFVYGFHKLPQNREILQWMREYNLDTSNQHHVNFYGFDISGGQGGSNRKLNHSLLEVLDYLKQVDEEAWNNYNLLCQPIIHVLDSGPNQFVEMGGPYDGLSEDQKNSFAKLIEHIINHFEIREIEFTWQTSRSEYSWAYMAALGLRHINNYIGVEDSVRNESSFLRPFIIRDRAMMDNIEWIDQKEDRPRMFLFANIAHLLKKDLGFGSRFREFPKENFRDLGQYLDLRHGREYRLIGNLHQFTYNDLLMPDIPDFFNCDSLGVEKHLVNDSYNNYYRDLRHIKDSLKDILNKDWILGAKGQYRYTNPYTSMDILLFTKEQNFVVEYKQDSP